MTPAEIADWRQWLDEWGREVTREYLADIQTEIDRINSEIDQCWAEWERDQ